MTAVLVVLTVLVAALLTVLWRRSNVSPLLTLALAFYFLLWIAISVALNTLFWDALAPHAVAGREAFVELAVLETLLFAAAVLPLLVKRPFFTAVVIEPVRQPRSFRVAIALGAVAILSILIEIAMARIQGGTYKDYAEFLVVSKETWGFRFLGAFTLTQFLLVSFIVATMLMRWPRGRAARAIDVIGVSWIGWEVAYFLLKGVRILMLFPIFMVVAVGEVRGWSLARRGWTTALTLAATLSLSAFLSIVVRQQREKGDLSVKAILSESSNLVKGQAGPSAESSSPVKGQAGPSAAADRGAPGAGQGGIAKQFLKEISIKFDAIAIGRHLLDARGLAEAGWKPFHGAALALVPRVFVGQKPVPGSRDGTYVGHPTRLAVAAPGRAAYNNAFVSPGAISLWQLGWGGLAILIGINVVQLFFINSLLMSPGLASRVLAVWLIGPPIFITVFPSAEVVLMNLQRVVVVYLLLRLARAARVRLRPAPSGGRVSPILSKPSAPG